MDIRIKKTKNNIKEVFIQLRSKKPLEKITVTELCKLAQINKSTFYSHYRDIFNLSDQCEKEVVNNLFESLPHPEYIFNNTKQLTIDLFNVCFDNMDIINIIFEGKQKNDLPDLLDDKYKEYIFNKFPQYKNDAAKNILISYTIYGGYHTFNKYKNSYSTDIVNILSELSNTINETSKELQ